jgi:predicted nucleic acid-binding protein
MAYLVDSNLLVRLANRADIDYFTARNAIFVLRSQGDALHTSPQNLIEFRNVATRPLDTNGLGLAPNVVEKQATLYERLFPILPETPEIYPAWKTLVQAAGVVGKQVHDARLVAVCMSLPSRTS